jgi:signal transduction histidine kinase
MGCHALAMTPQDDAGPSSLSESASSAIPDAGGVRSFGMRRMRDTVLAEVAHDLRSPLSAIIMTTDLLLQVPMTHEEHDHRLHMIRRSAEHMSRLVQDLVEAVRAERAPIVLNPAPFPVQVLLEEVAELHQEAASTKDQQLVVAVHAPAALMMNADRERLFRVLDNLVGNAIKFTQRGGHITVDALAGTLEVIFSVTDDGPGMDRNTLDRLFEPYWQHDPGTRQGLGLGLTISKALVEAHGGRIWAESEPGKGTVVFFRVPRL